MAGHEGTEKSWKVRTTLTVELETEVDAHTRAEAFGLAKLETKAHGEIVNVSQELLEVNGI